MERSRRSGATFEEHLWDKLIDVNHYNKRGIDKLQAVRQFGISYQKVIETFAKGLRQCGKQLLTDMTKGKHDSGSTLTNAVESMKQNLDNLAKKVEDSDVISDLVEPLE